MTDVRQFPRAISGLAPAETDVAHEIRRCADELAKAQGFVIVADMGAGTPLRILVGGPGYESASDTLFLLALGQRKILESTGV